MYTERRRVRTKRRRDVITRVQRLAERPVAPETGVAATIDGAVSERDAGGVDVAGSAAPS